MKAKAAAPHETETRYVGRHFGELDLKDFFTRSSELIYPAGFDCLGLGYAMILHQARADNDWTTGAKPPRAGLPGDDRWGTVSREIFDKLVARMSQREVQVRGQP